MRLPQELFAEALWLEWDTHYGVINKEKLPDLLILKIFADAFQRKS